MKLSDEQWAALRLAVEHDDREKFEGLVETIIRAAVRDLLVHRAARYFDGLADGRRWPSVR